ncbi:MAG: hypothetical protein JWM00_606 [Candidatus Saccharibacteria bacterium]|nr:hypothetical protein [Candidatus Saccharibacteria bacterium]
MQNEHTLIRQVRFTVSIGVLYILTLGIGWYALRPPSFVQHTAYASTVTKAMEAAADLSEPRMISGQPIRVVIAESGIDLPVDEGVYNSTDGSWTLSESHAQYATLTSLANDHSGNTFIYGHGTDQVLGALANVPPAVGSSALIYTSNGHVFSYSFRDLVAILPEDTSIFDYQGPPMLTIQTCTGAVSEWRTMFHFTFNEVVQ